MEAWDVLVIGSGSAACASALRAAKGGLKVLVIEKSEWLGGTSAMSGSGIWIPANHVAAAAGIADSRDEAIAYLRAVTPEGWAEKEDARWVSFVQSAPDMLRFLSDNTPLDLRVVAEPDPYAEAPGGKMVGRMVSPMPLSRRILGRLAGRLRRSTLPHTFTYQEVVDLDLYHHPIRAGLRMWPKLLWRWLTNSGGQGTALMTGMVKGCLDAGVTFWLETRAIRLIQDSDDRIVGAEVERRGQRQTISAERGVVIATGGFEWDPQMRERHFPGPLDRIGSPRSNEGDGQKLAASVGAELDRMDQANIYPCLPTRYQGKQHGLPMTFQAEPHSIVVNRHAKRFVSENDFNIGEVLDQRDANGAPVHLPCFLVGDHRFLKTSIPFRWFSSYERDWVKTADTIPELAAKLGLPADELIETISRWNEFCKTGHDTDFKRGENGWEAYKAHGDENRLKPIDKAPYVGMTINRSILGTKGGARTNDKGQVLRADGSLIPGLYAAGLAMANPFGTRAVGAGTTIGPNMTWGYIAAETILRQNR
ncbi:3-oxosteroid 1-dehydrogenase [Rhizobium subbaraonis]|uniref:3-oxosteroid 1-dehydrogenase n=1 Tax=Rhizobium subbaraonis TaxID=908946 RepID=A0A285UX28_9HYPH|nr:FAD-dependent oxidoreductase [Rhizobium subbaraonis]SOC46444.1 3-oxosteroid 1-dehydrogenase [Rhizobium subbaraonis]